MNNKNTVFKLVTGCLSHTLNEKDILDLNSEYSGKLLSVIDEIERPVYTSIRWVIRRNS